MIQLTICEVKRIIFDFKIYFKLEHKKQPVHNGEVRVATKLAQISPVSLCGSYVPQPIRCPSPAGLSFEMRMVLARPLTFSSL